MNKRIYLLCAFLLYPYAYTQADDINAQICEAKESSKEQFLNRRNLAEYLFDFSGFQISCLRDTTLPSILYAISNDTDVELCKNNKVMNAAHQRSVSDARSEMLRILIEADVPAKEANAVREKILDANQPMPLIKCKMEQSTEEDGSPIIIRESFDEVKKDLEEAKGAMISLGEDSEESNKLRELKFVVAKKFKTTNGEDYLSNWVAFAGVNRTSKIVGAEKKADDQVMEIQGGLSLDRLQKSQEKGSLGIYQALSVIVTSEEYDDSLVGDIDYTFSPEISPKINGGFWLNAWRPAYYPKTGGDRVPLIKPLFDFRLIAGHVFDDGASVSLRDGEEYIRFGYSTGMSITGGEGFLPKLNIDAKYNYLEIHNSPISRAESWDISLSWSLGESENASLTTSYTKGRTGVNLNETDKWALGLSYKI